MAAVIADLDQVRPAAHSLLERGGPHPSVGGQRRHRRPARHHRPGIRAPARLVVVSSSSHYDAKKGINFDALRQSTPSFSGVPEYAVSKLANVSFTQKLARRYPP